MRQASYDLHLHTCWSYDALAEPESYLRRADELGMRVLAITEHHVLDSQEEVQQASRAYPQVRVIPAAELTVTTAIGPVDLVCLGFRKPLSPPLCQVMEMYHRWQRDCGAALVRGMQALGHAWNDEDRRRLLEGYRPPRTIAVQGFTHVKNEIQREAFKRRGFIQHDDQYVELIGRARRAASAPAYPAAGQVVPALKAAGVLVVIAHPTNYFRGQDRDRMDALRLECGLDGIECAHPAVPPQLTPAYRAYCREHGLVSTAGTDCHTELEIEQSLGRHGGEESWLVEVLDHLPSGSD